MCVYVHVGVVISVYMGVHLYGLRSCMRVFMYHYASCIIMHMCTYYCACKCMCMYASCYILYLYLQMCVLMCVYVYMHNNVHVCLTVPTGCGHFWIYVSLVFMWPCLLVCLC